MFGRLSRLSRNGGFTDTTNIWQHINELIFNFRQDQSSIERMQVFSKSKGTTHISRGHSAKRVRVFRSEGFVFRATIARNDGLETDNVAVLVGKGSRQGAIFIFADVVERLHGLVDQFGSGLCEPCALRRFLRIFSWLHLGKVDDQPSPKPKAIEKTSSR